MQNQIQITDQQNVLDFNEQILEGDEKIIYLNPDKTAYLKLGYLPYDMKKYATDNFVELFNMHPKERHNIILRMEQVEVYRWQQSYLNTPPHYDEDVMRKKSYMFSGFDASNNNAELPKQFKIFYDYVLSKDNKYNQVVANWYGTGNDHIAYHSDCEIGMIPNAEIVTISLYEKDSDDNGYRTIGIVPQEGVDTIYDKINILAKHGLIITMCGDTQSKFRHGIEKTETETLPRISLSFRQYL